MHRWSIDFWCYWWSKPKSRLMHSPTKFLFLFVWACWAAKYFRSRWCFDSLVLVEDRSDNIGGSSSWSYSPICSRALLAISASLLPTTLASRTQLTEKRAYISAVFSGSEMPSFLCRSCSCKTASRAFLWLQNRWRAPSPVQSSSPRTRSEISSMVFLSRMHSIIARFSSSISSSSPLV